MAPNCRDADRLAVPVICGQIGERCMDDTHRKPLKRGAAEEVSPVRGVTLD